MARKLFIFAFVSFLMWPANAMASQQTASANPAGCSVADPPGLSDEGMRWRLRAYNNIECIMNVLRQALTRSPDGGKAQVTLSRKEVDELLNYAWWAKDAAQRIGR